MPGRCEFVSRSKAERGRCEEQGSMFDPSSTGSGILPYCVDCSRNLCERHLARHLCRAMRDAGAKRGEAMARYNAED